MTLKSTQSYPVNLSEGGLAVTVTYQAGELLVDDTGYAVGRSVNGTTTVPADDAERWLMSFVAKEHPGYYLVDWRIL